MSAQFIIRLSHDITKQEEQTLKLTQKNQLEKLPLTTIDTDNLKLLKKSAERNFANFWIKS